MHDQTMQQESPVTKDDDRDAHSNVYRLRPDCNPVMVGGGRKHHQIQKKEIKKKHIRSEREVNAGASDRDVAEDLVEDVKKLAVDFSARTFSK